MYVAAGTTARKKYLTAEPAHFNVSFHDNLNEQVHESSTQDKVKQILTI